MSYSNTMTPPSVVPQPSLYTGVKPSCPQTVQGPVSWGGVGVANHPIGVPHLSGHLDPAGQGPVFGGSSPFDGCVVDHDAVSRLKDQNFQLTRQKYELCTELRDTRQKLELSEQRNHELQNKVDQKSDIDPERYSQLLAIERKSSRAEDKGQRTTFLTKELLKSHTQAAQKIDELQNERDTLIASQEKLSETLKNIKSELKEVWEQSEQVQLKWSKAEQDVTELRAELKSVRHDKHILVGELDRAVDNASTAESKLAAASVKNHDLKTTVSELEAHKSELETAIRSHEHRIAYLNKEIERGDKELSAKHSANNQLTEELNSHQRNETRLQTELHNTKTSLEAANEQLTVSERTLKATQDELSKTKSEVLNLERQLTKVKGDKKYVSDTANQLQGKLKDKLEVVKDLQNRLDQAQKDVTSLREEVTLKTSQISYLRQELKASETKISGLEQRIQEQQSDVSHMHHIEAALEGSKHFYKELEQKNQKLTGELEVVQKRNEEIRTTNYETMVKLETTDKALKQEQLSHKQDVDSLKQEIEAQKGVIQTHLSSIKTHEKTIHELQDQLRSLRADLATAKSEDNLKELKQLRLDIELKEQKISTLQEQQKESQAQIDRLHKQVNEFNQQLAEAENTINNKSGLIIAQANVISDAKGQVLDLQGQLEEFHSLKESVRELRGGIQMAGNRMDDCSRRLQDLERKFQELVKFVDPIINNPNVAPLVTELKSDFKELGSEFSEIRTEHVKHSGILDSLESRTERFDSFGSRTEQFDSFGSRTEQFGSFGSRTEHLESSIKKSVTFKSEQRQQASIASDSSTLGGARASGPEGAVSQDELQRSLAADLGMDRGLKSENRLYLKDTGSDVTPIPLQNQGELGESRVAPRPIHTKAEDSAIGGSLPFVGRYGDGFSSSEDDYLRGRQQDLQPVSRDRDTVSPETQGLLDVNFAESASYSINLEDLSNRPPHREDDTFDGRSSSGDDELTL